MGLSKLWGNKMKASEAPVGEWIMVNRTSVWYKKEGMREGKVVCSRIGTKEVFILDADEPVMVRK